MPILALFMIPFAFTLSGSNNVPELRTTYLSGPELTANDRVLIIAPHPDDESLACAGVIGRCVENNIPVQVIIMNNGDGYRRAIELFFKNTAPESADFQRLGEVRYKESLSALGLLGLDPKNIHFLSYPDGGTSSLFDQNWDYDSLLLGLNGKTDADYSFAYEKDAPYCGANVDKNLKEIIERFRPTIIFFPDPQDDQHDHWATSAFVEYALTQADYHGKELTYLVHKGFDWPLPWSYAPMLSLFPPMELRHFDAKWLKFPLNKREEVQKHRAVNKYISQKDLMEPFLEAFVRKNELFAFYPNIKVSRIPGKPDFLTPKQLPHFMFADPHKDTLVRELSGLGDITKVGFVFDDNNDGWLAIEVRRRIARDIAYSFHARIFNGNIVTRFDIKVYDGVATPGVITDNSIAFSDPVPVYAKNRRIVIKIPAKVFYEADSVLLNVDSFKHARRIDRTAWRRIVFSSKQAELPSYIREEMGAIKH